MGSQGAEPLPHVFLVTFHGQGHVNPLLRLGKILASKGLLVTFSASQIVGEQIKASNKSITDQPTPVGDGFIRFEFFFDGLGLTDEDNAKRLVSDSFISHLAVAGKKSVSDILKKHELQGRRVSCLINNPFIPWISDLAEELGIPSAVLWVQSCASFSAYYHYYNNLVPFPTENEPKIDVQLPNIPLLKYDEIPGFLLPSSPYGFLRRAILGQFKVISKPLCILVETFQELEDDGINYMSTLCPIKPIGPLFLNPKAQNGSCISGDFLKAEDDCLDWLNTKPASSVVYISFGSIVYIKQEQITEIARGLADSGLSFLWAFKKPGMELSLPPVSLPDGLLEEVSDRGKVVQWCSQDKVLGHPAVSCFMSHCGWNSTMEALAMGVPVAAFPIWGDQVTDAKYLVDEFKVGVRICRGEADINKKVISRKEIARCLLEATSGPRAKELKENALRWKKAAGDAVAEGGTSNRNIQEFVDEIKRGITGISSK